MITKQKTEWKATYNPLNSERFSRRKDAEAWLQRMERGEAFKWIDTVCNDTRLIWSLNEWASIWQMDLKLWCWYVDNANKGTETTALKARQAARNAIHRNILAICLELFAIPAYFEAKIGEWRVDALLTNGAIIELNGGTRMRGSGSHSGAAAAREYGRLNALQLAGHRVFLVTPEMLWQHPAILTEFAA